MKRHEAPRFAKAAAFAAALLLLALQFIRARHGGHAQHWDPPDVPQEVGEFAYADLKAARKLSWFNQFRDQILPTKFKQFFQFLASAGVDPNTQVDEIAWAAVSPTQDHGEAIVGVALGVFNPSSSEAQFKKQKLPMEEVHGTQLFGFGGGTGPDDLFFGFLDTNTAIFGMRAVLEKMIDVRLGGSESLMKNDTLYPLITEANGLGTVWAVLD